MNDNEGEILKLMSLIDYGSVVTYQEKGATSPTYFIVKEIVNGIVKGQLATPTGVNSIPLEELLKKDKLSISDFRTFKKSQSQ